jgi:electron transfer flavoprotein alpha subunit
MKNILVIIDTIANKPSVSGFELISFAEQFAEVFSLDIQVIIAGGSIGETVEKASRYGHDVTGIEHEAFVHPNPDLLARAVAVLMDDIKPRYVCFQHTMRGCQMAASLSARLDMTCITAVESFRAVGDKPVFNRSLFNGKINIDLSPASDRSALTVLPGAFAAAESGAANRKPGSAVIRTISGIDSPCIPLAISESLEENMRLEESDVIISAGRGIGVQENLELIRAVSKLFPNSAVGASRTICDQKWLPYAHQVGVTGKTVSPKLYMACGISGAQQHIAGMKGSQLIVAVNTDPRAAIFSISDYIIIEDLKTFLPILMQKYEELYKRT